MLALSRSYPPDIDRLRVSAEMSRSLGGTLNDEVRSLAVALRRDGLAAQDIAQAIGVHETTLYGWIRSGKYDAFFRAMTIEAPDLSPSTNRDAASHEVKTPKIASHALFRIRYAKGTRVAIPLQALTPEILSVLLSVETSR